MKKLSVFLLSVFLIVLLAVTASADELTFEVEWLDLDVTEMTRLINEVRSSGNATCKNPDGTIRELGFMDELVLDPTLCEVAKQRAAEQVFERGHVRSDGSKWNTVYSEIVAENAGVIGYDDVISMFYAFMEEQEDWSGQGHRRAMLSANYTHVGISCAFIDGIYYWTMEFANSAPTTPYVSRSTETTATVDFVPENLMTEWNSKYLASVESLELSVDGVVSVPEITRVITSPDPNTVNVNSIVRDAVWSSSDSDIFTVENGMVHGVNTGSGTLIANINGATVVIPVSVRLCLHENRTEEILQPATCQKEGLAQYTCPDCGGTWTDVIPVSDHVPVDIVTGLNTPCLDKSVQVRCKFCNILLDFRIDEGLGHDYHSEVCYEATPESYGRIRHTCARCGEWYDEYVKYTGPELTVAPTVAPTATPKPTAMPTVAPTATPKLTAMPTVAPTATPKPTATPTVVPTATPTPSATPIPKPTVTPEPTATPSTNVKDCKHPRLETISLTPSTCKEQGTHEQRCLDCGAILKTSLPVNPDAHDFNNIGGATRSSSCGHIVVWEYCRNCNKRISDEVVAQEGNHEFGPLTVITPATETSDGMANHQCILGCGTEETVILPKLTSCKHEHTHKVISKEPTCRETGLECEVCDACGKTISSNAIKKTDHEWDYDATTINVEGTCQHPVAYQAPCKYCGATLIYTGAIENHRYEQEGEHQVCIWCGYTCKANCTHEHTHKEERYVEGREYPKKMERVEICDACFEIINREILK